MKPNNALQVLYDERLVGTLAMTADHKAAFQWIPDQSIFSSTEKAGFCSKQRLF